MKSRGCWESINFYKLVHLSERDVKGIQFKLIRFSEICIQFYTKTYQIYLIWGGVLNPGTELLHFQTSTKGAFVDPNYNPY